MGNRVFKLNVESGSYDEMSPIPLAIEEGDSIYYGMCGTATKGDGTRLAVVNVVFWW